MNFINTYKKTFISLVVAFCLVLLALTRNYSGYKNPIGKAIGVVVVPVQNVFSNASAFVKKSSKSFVDAGKLKDENALLRKKVEELSYENRRLRLVETEGKKLSELLKIDEKYPELNKIGAGVIARNSNNWQNSFFIDKGTKDGLTENLIVLTDGGLVGRIIGVYSDYSEVLTLMDEASSISVKCVRTEDTGLVKGDLTLMENGLTRMNFVELDAQIMEGDEIVTSTFSDIYPPGITVGFVKEVSFDSKRLTKSALVEPLVDFKNIETVLVVTDRLDKPTDIGESKERK